VHVRFAAGKRLARVDGSALGAPVHGYEIHHGRAEVGYGATAAPLIVDAAGAGEGCRAGSVFGTHWHGTFDGNEFRRAFLVEAARLAGRDGFQVSTDTDVPALREASLDRLGDLVDQHLDGAALERLIAHGAPPGLPFVPPGPPPAPPLGRPVPPATAPTVSTEPLAPASGPPPATSGTTPGTPPPPPTPTPAAAPGPRFVTSAAPRRLAQVLAVLDGTDRPTVAVGPPPARPAEPLVTGDREVVSFDRLAAEILAAPARCGPARVVAVDGRAGSGKSTLATRLTDALTATGAGVYLQHTDDLLQGWLDIVSFWPRLEEWVLAPLRRGEPARFRRYDWQRGAFPDRFEPIGRPDVLLLDGVTTARAAARPLLTRSLYVQTDRRLRYERGVRRDGAGVIPDWTRWMSDEDQHFAADRTVERVDLVVDGAPTIDHRPETHFVRIVPGVGSCQGFP
jgi:uridine kinase